MRAFLAADREKRRASGRAPLTGGMLELIVDDAIANWRPAHVAPDVMREAIEVVLEQDTRDAKEFRMWVAQFVRRCAPTAVDLQRAADVITLT